MVAPVQSNPWTRPYGNDISVATWSALGNGSGSPVPGAGWSDRSIQFSGTFDSGTAILEGSNDGVNYFTLNNPAGTPLSFTSAGLRQILEVVSFMRPTVSGGGASVAIDANLLLVQHRN